MKGTEFIFEVLADRVFFPIFLHVWDGAIYNFKIESLIVLMRGDVVNEPLIDDDAERPSFSAGTGLEGWRVRRLLGRALF